VQGVAKTLSDVAGGQDNLKAVIEWAGANADEATRNAFNSAMERGDVASASLMVRGLLSQYNDAVGVEGERIIGNGAGHGVKPFANWQQVQAVMRTPGYKNDPAVRADVEARMRASKL
jgi:hypothetical protein